MRIGIVGGLERNESQFQRMALVAGHAVEFHSGHVGSRENSALQSLIERSDLVIVVTDVNSHGSVQQARKLLQKRSVRSLLLRRFGIARFATLLAALQSGGWGSVDAFQAAGA